MKPQNQQDLLTLLNNILNTGSDKK